MESKEPKKKNITIHDIAEHLKLSPSTVSRALNDHPKINIKTKEKVWELAKKMGYYPNVPVYMTKESGAKVYIIIPEYNRYYTDVVEGVQSYLSKKSILLYVACSRENEELEQKIIFDAMEQGTKGIIICAYNTQNKYNMLLKHLSNNMQVVMLNKFDDKPEVSKIFPDVFNGAYKAVNHMYSVGCRSIGLFLGNITNPLFAEILSGYESALNILGENYDKNHVYFSNFKQDDVAHGIEKLITQKNRPDGILVGDQLVAQQIISYLRSIGIQVPQDLILVSFGDERFSSFVSPTLSSISISGEKIGRQAAKMLYKSIFEQTEGTYTQVTEVKLIIRGSSMRIRN
ncbi:MAG: LacI family DNA-binding transcriptional regulator [Bacteroidales bacterium]|nr:LacI family DNA-binding transcriptional regulator [Bacteroidales bacterium]